VVEAGKMRKEIVQRFPDDLPSRRWEDCNCDRRLREQAHELIQVLFRDLSLTVQGHNSSPARSLISASTVGSKLMCRSL
jgi:hypothetical protein